VRARPSNAGPLYAGKVMLRALLTLAAGSSLLAQWPEFPTPGVPRTSSGEVNMTAPAPRTGDGKPDFTGIWRNTLPQLDPNRFPAPIREAAPATRIPTGLEQFGEISSGLEGGLPLQPWAADLKKARMANLSKDNPDAHCLPMGNMQFHTHPQPRKMIQTPDLLLILYEGNAGIRQIFLDGRPLPKSPQPWWYGYSTGRWDGDTLVVETSGFRDDGWLDINGSPLTDQGRMIERFRRPDFGHLEIEITVDDPKAYTKPWTVTVRQWIMVDEELIEFICNENERDAVHLVGQ
jgi:hypothetical protein